MAFTVEDGTGVADANSLCSVEDADTYWDDRGNSTWAALSTPAKEAALVLASEYLSQSVAWAGAKVDGDQDLAWPRTVYQDLDDVDPMAPVIDYSGVPWRVVQATARVAALVAGGSDFFGTASPSSGATRYKAGSVEIQFSDDAARLGMRGRPDIPWLTEFLADFINRDSPRASASSRKVQRV